MRSSIFFLCSAICLALAHHDSTHHFKICVPHSALEACNKMVEQGKTVGVEMSCEAARDRYDCLTKIKDHKADFEAVDPEDMYLAAKLGNKDFSVFKEIRTKEEPEAEFRYEAVAVVHKDLQIEDIHGLKGLRSCHTGVGRNVGYKIPITKLSKMGLLGPLNNSAVSPRENELKALSEFFSKACLVGKWSPHPETNTRLKTQYSNLCELCEDPIKCDYPDTNSGYEGALKCLATAGGQVAWTKVIYVRKFFGMPYGNQPAAHSEFNPDDYAYLCPDATKRPVTGPPCTWAARPWPGYIANQMVLDKDLKELRDDIAKLNDLGESSHADWITTVLALNNKTLTKDNTPSHPMEYLEKAKYVDVIERGSSGSHKVSLCVVGKEAEEKCLQLSAAAYSRDVRPPLGCVSKPKLSDCLEIIEKGMAHLVVLDPHQAVLAEKKYKVKPLLMETYGESDVQELMAVVKKSSGFQKLADLKGKKACIEPYGHAGFTGTVKILHDAGLLSKNHCPYEKSLPEFFSAGVTEIEDPLNCLISGNGDVAFVPYSALHKTKEEVEVLCPSGRKAIHAAGDCHLATLPPQLVMTCTSLSPVQEDNVRFALLSAAQIYSKYPDYFLMFGPYNGHANIIFSDHATGLKAVPDVVPSYEEYKKMVSQFSVCQA